MRSSSSPLAHSTATPSSTAWARRPRDLATRARTETSTGAASSLACARRPRHSRTSRRHELRHLGSPASPTAPGRRPPTVVAVLRWPRNRPRLRQCGHTPTPAALHVRRRPQAHPVTAHPATRAPPRARPLRPWSFASPPTAAALVARRMLRETTTQRTENTPWDPRAESRAVACG
jgi:hypothetical protein